MTASVAETRRLLLGIGMATCAVALFGLGDALTKYLVERQPIERIAALRYSIGTLMMLAVLAPRMRGRLWRISRPWMVLVRSLTLAFATLVMGYTLRLMPVGETVAIMYLAPFAVMALAVVLLGEKVTKTGWLLAALGFAGVLLIVRPGAALNPAGVGLALCLAAATTGFHLITRVLTRTETPIALLFNANLVGAVLFTLAAIPTAGAPWPTLFDTGLMVFLGVSFIIGHFLFASAYREAPASLIAPVNYLHFVWAALMGWALFGHVPDGVTMIGMAMILVSGASIAVMAQYMSRPPR
ncbi:DMT family transporter [Pararhodobacter marinus]|nr:DMT family transporter [Pararhodobacter marinus]